MREGGGSLQSRVQLQFLVCDIPLRLSGEGLRLARVHARKYIRIDALESAEHIQGTDLLLGGAFLRPSTERNVVAGQFDVHEAGGAHERIEGEEFLAASAALAGEEGREAAGGARDGQRG